MLNAKVFLANLTHHPGIYQMLSKDGDVIYIGKARDLKKRLASYFSGAQQDAKTLALMRNVADIEVTVTNTENEALLLECNLIKKHQPRYNVLFRDDKSYPYILITSDDKFPRIDFYRGNRKRKGVFFGPFPSAGAVRQAINLIQKLFKLRVCSDSFFANRSRPCLQYQINRCTAPCVAFIDEETYALSVRHAILFLEGKSDQILKELNHHMADAANHLNYELAAKIRNQIARLREIQIKQHVSIEQGDADVISAAWFSGVICLQLLTIRGGIILGSKSYFPSVPADSSKQEILTSFISQHYLATGFDPNDIPKEIIVEHSLEDSEALCAVLTEKAGHKVSILTNSRGERKRWQEIALNSAETSVNNYVARKTNLKQRFDAFKVIVNKAALTRIECFDISHTRGEATIGSCVVFDQQGPVKSLYRQFNIKNVSPGDDIAAMKQVLFRRYKRLKDEGSALPDVVIVDGGIAQLKIAEEVMQTLCLDSVLLMGISKGVTRKAGFETLHFLPNQQMVVPADSLALHLIQQIRDEAHRFAITAHRKKREKQRRISSLEKIPGIGAKRRKELLLYFGGIQALNRASLEELAKVPGISFSLAERIFAALHNVVIKDV